MTSGSPASEVPPTTRAFVVSFLGVFLVCGLAGLELWPFTGWRLFSEVRRPTQVGWQAVTVHGGEERPVPFDRLPRGFSGALHVMAGLAPAPPDDQRQVCRAWAVAVERLGGGPVEAVRVYRTTFGVRDGALRSRELRVECTRRAGW